MYFIIKNSADINISFQVCVGFLMASTGLSLLKGSFTGQGLKPTLTVRIKCAAN